MKKLLIGLLALGTLSAFAEVNDSATFDTCLCKTGLSSATTLSGANAYSVLQGQSFSRNADGKVVLNEEVLTRHASLGRNKRAEKIVLKRCQKDLERLTAQGICPDTL